MIGLSPDTTLHYTCLFVRRRKVKMLLDKPSSNPAMPDLQIEASAVSARCSVSEKLVPS